MKTSFKCFFLFNACICFSIICLFISCDSASTKESQNNSILPGEYFSVKIKGKTWVAYPSKEFKEYNLSYKELGHQFSIFAEAEDGSRIDLSFHALKEIIPGQYPSTKNDNGMLSGIFYYPESKSSDKELASITSDVPVQENAVQITKVDKRNRKAYIIEGTFTPVMYAVYETNPEKSTKFMEGKFRVIYRPDAMNPIF